MKINRGSEWSRWDLHIHTPGTKLNDQFRDSDGNPISQSKNNKIWKEYCSMLNESGIKCFGITDYFSIENYLYLKEKRDEFGLNEDIELFPNIELRVTGLVPKGKSKSPHKHVNLHVVFSNDSDKVSDELLIRFLRYIEVRDEVGRTINYYDDFDKLRKDNCFTYLPNYSMIEKSLKNTFGKDYKEFALILVPNGNDGLSTESGTHHEANTNYMKNSVDIIQTTSLKDKEFFLSEKCNDNYGRNFPCISGSDAHDFKTIKDYPIDKSTWIKAERNFEGLKSILYEPEYRVRIQETSPSTKLPSKLISHIKLPEKDFGSKEVYFNDDLNVIIGGRSSGKSLLLSLLGKKAYGIKNIKGNDSRYNDMISEKLDDTKLFNKSNAKIEDNMIIEFFYQDKLQDIARNQEKLNSFVEKTLGTSETVSIANRDVDKKKSSLKDLVHTLLQKKEDLENLKKQSINLQDQKTLEKNISDIEENIGKISVTFSKEENKKIIIGNKKIEEHGNNIETKKDKLEKIIELFDKDIVEINKELIEESNELLGSDFKDLVEEINKINDKYRKQLASLKGRLIEEKKRLEDEVEIIKSQELMAIYFKNIEDTPELEKLTTSLKTERCKLNNRLKYNEQNNKIEEEIVETTKEICKKITWTNFIREEKVLTKNNLMINHKISINYKLLADIFFKNLKIGHRVYKDIAKGSFKEIISYEENTDLILESSDFIDTLKNIILSEDNQVFRSDKDISSFLSDLSDLRYIISDYNILYEGLEFERMSEGKKALVLLLIKLEIGEEDCPILIDQPEDDLDNRSIMEDIISYFKEEKLKRQVFIVTHNANIVISCDSENIIIANEHDSKNPNPENIKYYYKNGSLEDINIRSKVCEILEGGEDAFKARENRYTFVI